MLVVNVRKIRKLVLLRKKDSDHKLKKETYQFGIKESQIIPGTFP